MSWKCEICDTYNEEELKACFVCGQARSKGSIREGQLRKRMERIEKATDAMANRVFNILRNSVRLVVLVLFFTFAVLLINKTENEKLSDMEQMALAASEQAYEHMIDPFNGIEVQVIYHIQEVLNR